MQNSLEFRQELLLDISSADAIFERFISCSKTKNFSDLWLLMLKTPGFIRDGSLYNDYNFLLKVTYDSIKREELFYAS